MQPGLLINLQLSKAVVITCNAKTGGKLTIIIKKKTLIGSDDSVFYLY